MPLISSGFIQAVRKLPPSAVFCFAVAVMLGTTGMTKASDAWPWGQRDGMNTAQEAAQSSPASEDDDTAEPVRRRRCATCGMVESMKLITFGDGSPPVYEIAVRLRDRSIRTSRINSPTHWRAGDRIMLIGGASAASTNHTGE